MTAESDSRPGSLWRAFSRVVALPRVSPLVMRLATVIDRPLLKASGGRLRLSFVIPCLLLRCRGARTGILREVPLLYVPDGDDLLLVGSGGGAARAPAWCANLLANPHVETVRGGEVEVRRAELLSGPARTAAWQRAVAVYPGYERYQERVSREIPIFRLRRLAAPGP
ncbi:MAG: nitroreductase family deazaflavin-dependent oxidoreductase [Pseudomonadales bacterium]